MYEITLSSEVCILIGFLLGFFSDLLGILTCYIIDKVKNKES